MDIFVNRTHSAIRLNSIGSFLRVIIYALSPGNDFCHTVTEEHVTNSKNGVKVLCLSRLNIMLNGL